MIIATIISTAAIIIVITTAIKIMFPVAVIIVITADINKMVEGRIQLAICTFKYGICIPVASLYIQVKLLFQYTVCCSIPVCH